MAVDITGDAPQAVARLRSMLTLKPGDNFSYAGWRADHDRIRRFFIDAGYLTARVIPTRRAVEGTAASGLACRSPTRYPGAL